MFSLKFICMNVLKNVEAISEANYFVFVGVIESPWYTAGGLK